MLNRLIALIGICSGKHVLARAGGEELYKTNMFYINLDHKTIRNEDFLSMFRKFNQTNNLHRVSGVDGTNMSNVMPYIDCALEDIPGLAELAPGEEEWNGSGKRPQWNTGPMWQGALGCTLAHLLAAYQVVTLDLTWALIVEDDVTDELIPYWQDAAFHKIIKFLPRDWDAVQLSTIAHTVVWKQLRAYADSSKSPYVTFSDKWLASNGAYMLSRHGAELLMQKYRNPESGRFDLSKMLCINADLCLLPYVDKKFHRSPPMFMHKYIPGQQHDSDIGGLDAREVDIQAMSLILARDEGLDWAKSAYSTYSQPNALTLMEPVDPGTCIDAIIGSRFDIPVFFLNDDDHPQRRERFEATFGCLDLTRIPAISGNNSSPNYWEHWVIADSYPGVLESENGGKTWSSNQRIKFKPTALNLLLLQRTLSHLRALSAVVDSGQEYALILEDTMDASMLNLWMRRDIARLSLMIKQFDAVVSSKDDARWTMIQLSSYGDKATWRQLDKLLAPLGPRKGNLAIPDLFIRGMSAYIVSREGASELLEYFYSRSSKRADFSSAKCINYETCIATLLKGKGASMPPIFIESTYSELSAEDCDPKDSYDNTCRSTLYDLDYSESIIGDEETKSLSGQYLSKEYYLKKLPEMEDAADRKKNNDARVLNKLASI